MIQSSKMAKPKGRETHPEGDKISVGPEERVRIKAAREARGWSQKELAGRVGATQGTISNLENSERQIYLSVYQKVIRALRLDAEAPSSMDSYKRIVEGAAELSESQRDTVAALIETLKKTRQQ